MIEGFILSAAGTAVCLLNPVNLIIVLAGQFVKSLGMVPSASMMTVFLGEALDDVEICSGVRCDGFYSSVYNIIGTIKAGAALGIFNFGLTQLGYVAPGIL